MSFDSLEKSVDSGRPLELLKISFLTNHWCYCSGEISVIHDGQVYMPLPMEHTEVNPTGDIAKSSITIRVPMDCEVGELFRVQPPAGVVTVTVFRRHVDDEEAKVIWKGRIVNYEREEPWVALTSENAFSSLQRLGVRRKHSSQCPHALYSIGEGLCNVDRNLHEYVYFVTSISGLTVNCASAAGHAPAMFAGGYMTWVNNVKGYLEMKMVTESDAAGNFILTAPAYGLTSGQQVKVYPGCDHRLSTCHQKFSNSENHGGTPFTPQKNPFGGSSLY